MSLFEELKRRNVIRVGIAYVVIAWLIAQVADLALDNFEAPGWIIKTILLLLALGLPLALFFAWAFELTPEGIRRESQVDRGESIAGTTGRRLDRTIIALLVALVAIMGFQQLAPRLGTPEASAGGGNDAGPIPIAVLPFADLSAAGDQEYLGDGVAEEILNVLAGIDGLKVTSRTSAFAFKGQNRPIPEIAGILGVSHIVEGSIRKQDDRVRITAQLIDVSDDSHVWSDTYDSDLSDIFRLQDTIASQISAALSASLDLHDRSNVSNNCWRSNWSRSSPTRGRKRPRRCSSGHSIWLSTRRATTRPARPRTKPGSRRGARRRSSRGIRWDSR